MITATAVLALDLVGTFAFEISGAAPPAALVDWRYLVVSIFAGLIKFYGYRSVERLRHPMQLFDAVGLGLFGVTGAGKALAFGLGSSGAALLGPMCVVAGDALGFPPTPTAVVGATTCIVLRYLAIQRNWQLPVAGACPDR